ncbi:MAG: TGS domain-containing protein, partial [Oscillibacter sp.]
KQQEYDAFMARTQAQIDGRLNEVGVSHVVYGRMKHPYSIYRKMFNQNKSLDEIFDLFAFRVVVDNVGDCYNVLGVIHDIYKPILGRFKDYIGTAKPNGYQSLHTTVMGNDGIPFEVQIRTREMHEIAEYGVAAHWKYKQNGQGGGTEGRYEWVRRLLENQEGADAEDYIRSLKIDMFADEVFVFTPNGDVQNLPSGATPIDFAYSVHSAVGNHMTGAKVNNRIVTFDHVLKNGDIVEILTSKNAKGPSRDWMKIAKSSEAKSKIRQWFKKEKREENIANGRAAFENELKHCGILMKTVMDSENLPVLLKRVAFGTLDEMYASIGYGGFTAQKAVNRMQSELNRIQKQLAEKLPEEEPGKTEPARPAAQPVKSAQGIIVEGLDNCLVKFSKCCTPVPGDEIIGFITRGYGVSVHRCDCPNASAERRALPGQEGRWIKVSWGADTGDSYPTILEVVCKDRISLLLDISTVLSATNTYVLGIQSRSTEDQFAIFHLEIRVRDSGQLGAVMNKLNQISGVLRVTRPAGG